MHIFARSEASYFVHFLLFSRSVDDFDISDDVRLYVELVVADGRAADFDVGVLGEEELDAIVQTSYRPSCRHAVMLGRGALLHHFAPRHATPRHAARLAPIEPMGL